MKTRTLTLFSAILLTNVCAFAQTTKDLLQHGRYTISEPVILNQEGFPYQGYWPDGKFCMLPNADTGYTCYWAEGDTYRTEAGTTHLEEHIANHNWQAVMGRNVSKIDGFNDGGSWIIGIYRLEDGRLVGFFHAESHWPNSWDGAYKSIGVTYSNDDGYTWEPGQRILASNKAKPQEPAWSGLGDGCVVWNKDLEQYICYYPGFSDGDHRLCMAASSDIEGKAGTWKKWNGSKFSVEGCNPATQLGGADKYIAGLHDVSGSNPSVMWNEYLGCWVMTYASWSGDIYISTSADGLKWLTPKILFEESGKKTYPNMISEKGDLTGGKCIRLYYGKNQGDDGIRELAYRDIVFDDAVTVTADNKEMNYGDNIPRLTYKKEGVSLRGTPKLTTEAESTSPVGEYVIKVEKGTVKNAEVTFVDGTLTINKAPLAVGVQDVTITEGDAIPEFILTYDGFRNNDTEDDAFATKPTASTTATEASQPGTYPIIVSGGTAMNYALTYTNGILTIKENSTGIPSLEASTPQQKTICCLSGRQVANGKLPKGIYIQNGHKVVIK